MASSSDPAPLLPGSLHAKLAAWLRGVLGYALLAGCCAAAASLLTWSAADPSFIHTTNGPARNALGPVGANLADLAMRLFGLAAVFIILPPAFWALQLITRRQLEDARMKLMLAPPAVLLLACAASALPKAAAWPLPYGLGGLLGDQTLKFVGSVLVSLGPERAIPAAGILCCIAGLALLTTSLGMSAQDLRLICQAPRPRLNLLARGWRRLVRAMERGDDHAYVRREPTLDLGPGTGTRSTLRPGPFSAEPAFVHDPRLAAPASDQVSAVPDKRMALRRPVQDPDFDRTTDTGCRAMAQRFAPAREEPTGAQGLGLLRRRGSRARPLGGETVEAKPVWPGSVPAAAEVQVEPAHRFAPGPTVGDELYGRAVAVVRADRKASAEYLQQRLGIAYMRAADLIDRMEQEGIVGPPAHNGQRPILSGLPRARTV
jgi:DNA segregation ATPase FtsK/SpoIIIE-like protein